MLRRQKVIVLVSLLFTIVVLISIWQFSAQNATESSKLSDGLAQIIAQRLGWKNLGWLSHFLRKMAHFTIYFALGCGLTGVLLYQRIISLPLVVPLSGVIFATLDEVHQIFVPGRGPSVLDIVLDTCGAIVGLVFVLSARLVWHAVRKNLAKRVKSGG